MTPLILGLSSLALLLALAVERRRLTRSRNAIPLVISVTGTRGKTTVVRLLASVLRVGGRRVLAKTTGSEPTRILPDGTVEPIRRRGQPSILEQKRLLREGARLGVDIVVAEVMSIHAENHRIESQEILRPTDVLVTNFYVDHTEAVGSTRDDVARVLALDVPPGARVFVPAHGCPPAFRDLVETTAGEIVEAPVGSGRSLLPTGDGPPGTEHDENLDLVVSVSRALGLDDDTIRRGVAEARQDVGALRVWKVAGRGDDAPAFLASAFAANDPESTWRVYDGLMARLGTEPGSCVGLLSLRPDRGDRSLQWAEALASGGADRFLRIYVTGLHARALRLGVGLRVGRRVGRRSPGHRHGRTNQPAIDVLETGPASALTDTVLSGLPRSGGVVFGFGNMVGTGRELAGHWARVGEETGHGV